jgi:hypothetical protein
MVHNCYCVRFEVFEAVTMKNGVFWDVTPVILVRTEVSEELSASRRASVASYSYFCFRLPILVTLMKEALRSSETSVLTRATGHHSS